jgi:hypothetical protein
MAKRIFQGVVLFFAIYAFVFLPLGKKTALEHIQAIVGTPAAQDAAEEVKGGVTRLVRRLRDQARESTEDTDRWMEEHAGRDGADDELSPARPAAPRRPDPTKLRGDEPKPRAMSAETPK